MPQKHTYAFKILQQHKLNNNINECNKSKFTISKYKLYNNLDVIKQKSNITSQYSKINNNYNTICNKVDDNTIRCSEVVGNNTNSTIQENNSQNITTILPQHNKITYYLDNINIPVTDDIIVKLNTKKHMQNEEHIHSNSDYMIKPEFTNNKNIILTPKTIIL